MHQKVRYQSPIFRRHAWWKGSGCWVEISRQSRECCVEIGDAGWKQNNANKYCETLNVNSLHINTLRQIWVNTLRPRQDGRHYPDDIFNQENAGILLKISLKFVPKVRINNIPALVQIMAWRRSGDKPLSEPMLVSLLTHICVTRPQWVKLVTSSLLWFTGTTK